MVLGKCNIINTESNNHSMGIDLKLRQGKGVTSRYVVSPMASLGDLDHIGHTDHHNSDHTNQNFGGLRIATKLLKTSEEETTSRDFW